MWQILLIVLGSIVVVVVLAVAIGNYAFSRKVDGEVRRILAASRGRAGEIVSEADLEGLPEPVQRYLRYSGIVGVERIQTCRLKQRGKFRASPGGSWMPFEAEEYYTVDPPAFIWRARMQAAPLLTLNVRDMYADGHGAMFGKLLSLFTVVNSSGSAIDQGALARYFNEIFWFPTAYLSDDIRWQAIDEDSAKATIRHGDVQVEAVLHFNVKGEMIDFVAERFFTTLDGRESLETWTTPIYDYREFNGLRLPARGKAVWKLASGDYKYIELELLEVEYNV